MSVRGVLHVLAVLGLASSLSACNTVAGIGQDLQAAGPAITGSSERAQQRNANPAQTPAPAASNP
jgi:predicted small secreted protein